MGKSSILLTNKLKIALRKVSFGPPENVIILKKYLHFHKNLINAETTKVYFMSLKPLMSSNLVIQTDCFRNV